MSVCQLAAVNIYNICFPINIVIGVSRMNTHLVYCEERQTEVDGDSSKVFMCRMGEQQ